MRRLILLAGLYRRFGWRHLWMSRGRAVTVIVGIAIGAAVFTSVRLSVNASLASFSRSVEAFTGSAQFVVTRSGGRLPERLVADLVRDVDVLQATPVMRTYVRHTDHPGASFLLVGIDPILDAPFREWAPVGAPSDSRRVWSGLISRPFTVIAGKGLLDQFGWRAGDEIPLVHARQTRSFRILAGLADGGLSPLEGGRFLLTDIATFQEFTGIVGTVDRVDLMVREGFDAAALQQRLPTGTRIRPAASQTDMGNAMIRAYQLNLSVLSFASLFVGMFLVYSLVALNAASRRKELAILHALGATPRTVMGLFLLEGFFLGTVGWLIAVPLGGLLTRGMIGVVSETISTLFVRVQVDQLHLSGAEILLSYLLTAGVSTLAAAQPALEAMRVPPREVMRAVPGVKTAHGQAIRLAIFGGVLLALVVPVSRLPGWSGVPLPGYAATVMLFAGFALLAPLGLRAVGQAISPVLHRLGMPAYLAGRYVRDSGTRTAVSVGALITAVALFTSLVIMIASFRGTVAAWVDQTISGDLFVAPRLGEANDFQDPMSHAVVAGLRKLDIPHIRVASRRISLTQGRFSYQLEAMEMAHFFRRGDFLWYAGAPDIVREQLISGNGVVVSEVFMNRTGLGAGDMYLADIAGHAVRFPILGVIRDYRTRGGLVFMDMAALEKIIPNLGWTGARFYLDLGRPVMEADVKRLEQAVIHIGGDHLDSLTGRRLRDAVMAIFDDTFSVTTVLLVIALVVAALGIATTLTVLVLERRRQLNTLFAVGGARRQIRGMILWESLILVAAGEVAGLLCGFMLSYLLIYVINPQSFGWSFVYRVDWPALAVSVPLVAAVALFAAIPALRAVFRRSPAELLREV